MSTIEINIEGRNPRAVLTRLMEQIQVIIDECMKSLIFFAALTYSSRGDCNSNNSLVFDDDRFLIPMKQIQSVVESHSVLNRPGGRRLLTEAEAKSYFNAWLKGHHDLKSFDLFLSYRWGANDSTFVQSIYDRSSLYTLEDDNREVVVFLDKEWLHEGRYYNLSFYNLFLFKFQSIEIELGNFRANLLSV